MLRLHYLLFSLLIISSCAREINEDQLVTRDGIVYEINSSEPYNGSSIGYHENGQIETKRTLKDGENEGLFESFYDNGSLHLQVNFNNGLMNGLLESYQENGCILKKGLFVMGMPDGRHEQYHNNCQMLEEVIYEDFEKLSEIRFYEDGSIGERIEYKNNRKIKHFSQSEDGTLLKDLTYDYIDGELLMSGKDIISNDGISGHITWKDGMLNGPAEIYDSNTEDNFFHGKGSFKNNLRDGIWHYWDVYGKRAPNSICFRKGLIVDSINVYKSNWDGGDINDVLKDDAEIAEDIEKYLFYCGSSEDGNWKFDSTIENRKNSQ